MRYSTKKAQAAFEAGFRGDDHKILEPLGVATVRHMLETRQFQTELQYNAAVEWLGLKEARASRWAKNIQYVHLTLVMLGVIVALVAGITFRGR